MSKKAKDLTHRRKYDAAMIRDFLAQLGLEVRIRHAESTHLRDKVDPNLVSQLMPFAKKYKVTALLVADLVGPDPGRGGEVEAALDLLHAHNARWTQASMDALEMLQPVFDEALKCSQV